MSKTWKDNLYKNGERQIRRTRKHGTRLLKKFSKKVIRKTDNIMDGNNYKKHHDKWHYE